MTGNGLIFGNMGIGGGLAVRCLNGRFEADSLVDKPWFDKIICFTIFGLLVPISYSPHDLVYEFTTSFTNNKFDEHY